MARILTVYGPYIIGSICPVYGPYWHSIKVPFQPGSALELTYYWSKEQTTVALELRAQLTRLT